MIKVGPYETFSHSYTHRQTPSLTIKRDGMILARMRFKEPICDPLRQIQMYPANPYRAELIGQLVASGVSSDDILDLLRVAPSKYMIAKKESQNEH